MSISSLLLSAHGHAPYILGTKILRMVASEICIPDYYGDKQRNILLDVLRDVPEDGRKVFLSKSLGDHLRPLLRDNKSTPGFNDYAASVEANFRRKSEAIKSLVQDGVEAVSLTGEKKTFTKFDFALNTGLPVLSPIDPVYYVFVGEMSAIYRLSPIRNRDTITMEGIWEQVEATFKRMFIPILHSLAYCEGSDWQADESKGITLTPPLEAPYPADNSQVALDGKTPIRAGSNLVIFSGTGMDRKRLVSLTKSAPVVSFTLPDAGQDIDLPRVSPNAWNNPNFATVLARSGLGSVWNAALNDKPIGVLEAQPEDDPEIYHNARMVQWAEIGLIVKDSLNPLVENAEHFAARIKEWQGVFKQRFGTVDGIRYTAEELRRIVGVE